jgi:hypothetical protein
VLTFADEHLLAHLFGAFGLASIVMSWQFKARERILLANVVGFLFFAVQLFLLEALTGALMMGLAALYTTVSIFTIQRRFVYAFALAVIGLGVTTYSGWVDILPTVANLTGLIAFFAANTHRLRLWAPLGTILWAIHNFIVGAWSQALADLLILTSMLVGYLRHQGWLPAADSPDAGALTRLLQRLFRGPR